MLKIKNLTKVYGDFVAVDDVSLEIKPGVIYGFIGHNGAGKTTTLKSVVGIHEVVQGDILIDGVSIKEEALLCKSKVAYIPDNPDLYGYMTGNEYIQFVCDIYRVSVSKRKDLIEKYSTLFSIQDALNLPIKSYSHGMQQKVAIIAAFVHEPKLIVMDEPFVGLDPKTAKSFKLLMKEYCAKGNAIFFSTHVLEVAEKLCDEIAIIKQGKIVVHGNTKEVIGKDSLEDYFLELV